MSYPSKREQIVEAALALFYRKGFNATGVEEIRREAGVSKKTLYHHFGSKDDLILAALRRRDEHFRTYFKRAVERFGETPRERLEALFDAADDWFHGDPFHGCMFINASAEFTALDNPNHLLSAEHKRLMHAYVRDLATRARVRDPDELAWQLNLLIEGATVKAHVEGDTGAAKRAKGMGKVFIDLQFDGAG